MFRSRLNLIVSLIRRSQEIPEAGILEEKTNLMTRKKQSLTRKMLLLQPRLSYVTKPRSLRTRRKRVQPENHHTSPIPRSLVQVLRAPSLVVTLQVKVVALSQVAVAPREKRKKKII